MQQVYLNLSGSDKKCEIPGIKCVCFQFQRVCNSAGRVCFSVSTCMLLRFFVYDFQF